MTAPEKIDVKGRAIGFLDCALDELAQRRMADNDMSADDFSRLQAAEEEALSVVASMAKALHAIATLSPQTDSDHGHNEWGEAECFSKAQSIAHAVLSNFGEQP